MINLQKIENDQIENFYWSFFGCFMQQTPQAVLSLNKLLNAINFKTIIEIGTHCGGLSSLFALYSYGSKQKAYSGHQNEPSLGLKNSSFAKIPTDFYTFDIVLRDIPRSQFLNQLGAECYLGDCLNDSIVIDYIKNLIQKNGRSLVMCDGGNKVKEVELYSAFLKPGDVIMAHDYFSDINKFNELKHLWSGWETSWDEIKTFCEKNNIEQIYQEEFDKAFWFCGIKR